VEEGGGGGGGIMMMNLANINFSMLQMLSLDVADTCCWVLQTLNFNVADVSFDVADM
jgi:hypothetical protein